MPNHYHLMVETPEPDLAVGMHGINHQYAVTFNRRHDTSGHLFQGRYRSVLVQSESHLLELQRYIALNPVRGELCRRPEDWPWSSYAAMFGEVPAPPFFATAHALAAFDDGPGDAREQFRSFVEAGLSVNAPVAA
jgi:hypothetical protein